MKPKIFIGSSVEGLNIAYSIQQNLSHDAEITVWDQGVFELSKTTIESLMEKLDSSDFGVFIFSEDDVITIRDKTNTTVRDNVLFEFGLFIGKLTRERVYFIIPSDSELHLPTDLLGITPGRFESTREDDSMQAATGPVSNQIRQQIKKLGKRIEDELSALSADKDDGFDAIEHEWITDFMSKDFDAARKKLQTSMKKESDGEKKIEKEIWIAYCDFKKNEIIGEKQLEKLLRKHSSSLFATRRIAEIYFWEDYLDRAVQILNQSLIDFEIDTTIIKLLSDCYIKIEGANKAIEFLKEQKYKEQPDIAIKLCTIHEENENINEARNLIHEIYMRYPSNEEIKYKYARIALEVEANEIALYLLKSLTIDFPENADYWGYLSNCAVHLSFNDLSLVACRKAEELSKSKSSWIISNIGNILNNRGLYSEAIKYFEKGIDLNKESEYSHNRLASAIKLKEEENKQVEIKRKEGLKAIRDYGKE